MRPADRHGHAFRLGRTGSLVPARILGYDRRQANAPTRGTRKFKQPDGEEVEAEVVGFRSAGEHWNEYLLDDGTLFKIKLVVTEIASIKDRFAANGEPIYAATHTQVTFVDAPETLREL